VGHPEDVSSNIFRKVDNQLPIYIVPSQNNLFFINNLAKFSDRTSLRFVRFQRHETYLAPYVVPDVLDTVRLFKPKIQNGMPASHLFAGEMGTGENLLCTTRLKDLIAAPG
jgi:hypothetical protein